MKDELLARARMALGDVINEVEEIQFLWPQVPKAAEELLQQPVGGLFAALSFYKDIYNKLIEQEINNITKGV